VRNCRCHPASDVKLISPNSTWLVTSRHETTRHVRRVEPMYFGCVELVEQHGSTHSTLRVRLARHDERDRRDSQLSLLRNLYQVMICKLFTNFLEYTFIYFILFNGTNRICVCKSIKTTKLVQVSTIACSSSAMLEQHGSTRSTRLSRLARHVEHVESCRDVT